MFASEYILLNSTICALELSISKEKDKLGCRWAPRDIIFTDRSLYIFAEVPLDHQNTGIPTANYLNSVFERMDLIAYKAEGIFTGTTPYANDIPQFYQNRFNQIVELVVKETNKRRIIACDSKKSAENFVQLFNVVSAYRNYLNPEKDGHPFINKWVRDYFQHNGEMWFDRDTLQKDNLIDFQIFGQNNDGIKSLVFSGDALNFSQGEDAVTIVTEMINSFNGESFKKIILKDNGMKNQYLTQIQQALVSRPLLDSLELSGQLLTGDSLSILSTIFKENKYLTKVNLTNNQLGVSQNIKDKFQMFLDSYLKDLYAPLQLDLSYNMIDDESLYPIVKYLFANVHSTTLAMVNLEWNNFSNKAKRTLVVAYSKCYNKKLQCKFGPLPLTQATLRQATAVSNITRKEKIETLTSSQKKSDDNQPDTTVELVIRRRPANPEIGMKYLPLNHQLRDEIQKYKDKISEMIKNKQNVFVEDIQELMYEIATCEVEFPRYLLEPLFIMCNEMIQASIDTNNLYTLEILLDVLSMMNARNFPAEEKYNLLANEAQQIGIALNKAINIDQSLGSDDMLLKVLVENLNRAKDIGMRGEIIDLATTLKALCTKLLQEMVQQAPKQEDENDQEPQLYILREEDKRSIFDPKYFEFCNYRTLDQFMIGFPVDFEPNLGLHPFNTDYIKLTNINVHFARKNMNESLKFLIEDEVYPLINVHTRAAFLLSNGGPDSSKSLHFSNVKDDICLRYARLIFRYRLNLDELLEPCIEPPVYEGTYKEALNEINGQFRIEDFQKLNVKDLSYSEVPIQKPLTQLVNYEQTYALKINKELIQVHLGSDDVESQYKAIRSWFQSNIISKTFRPSQDLQNEVYIQLYKQLQNLHKQQTEFRGRSQSKDKNKVLLVIFILLTHYWGPSQELQQILLTFLKPIAEGDYNLKRLAKLAIQGLYTPRNHEQTGRAYYDWPPSLYEIESLFKEKKITVNIQWPTGEFQKFEVTATTTIESLLKNNIWTQPFFSKEPEFVFYWLFTCEDDLTKFPRALSRDQKILKLMSKDEIYQENLQKQVESANEKLLERSKSRRRTLQKKQNDVSETKEVDFKFFTLQLRRRIFPSFYHQPAQNFKSLSATSRNFIFHQGRLDYVERDILKRPILSQENATMLATLAFKVKFQQKILRSKENTLTADIFNKHLEFAIPPSMLITQKPSQWETEIIQCFEKQNMKELSNDEAQDQFLTLLSSYEYMFASYSVIQNKPVTQGFRQSLLMNNKKSIEIRKQTNDSRELLKSSTSLPKPMARKKSRFDDSDSEEESSIDLSKSKTESDDDSQNNSMKLDEDVTEAMKQGFQVFQEYFQSQKEEILLICTHQNIFFVENRKRDKILLKVKFQDILFLMGKQDELTLGLILQKKMSNNNQTYDCKIDFLVDGGCARSIPEDILTYCQIYLLEHSLIHQEYCDIIRRNVIDGLFDSEISQNEETAGWKLVIDDDILLGKVNLASTQTKLKEKKQFFDDDHQIDEFYNAVDEENENSPRSGVQKLTVLDKHEAKIQRQIGMKIKIKQPNFVIYMRKHPLYQSDNIRTIKPTDTQKRTVANLNKTKFNPTTIDEESSDSSSSEQSQYLSQVKSVSSNYNSGSSKKSQQPQIARGNIPPAPQGRGTTPIAPVGGRGIIPNPQGRGIIPVAPVGGRGIIPAAPVGGRGTTPIRPTNPIQTQVVQTPQVNLPIQAQDPVPRATTPITQQQHVEFVKPSQLEPQVTQPVETINTNDFMAAYKAQNTVEEKPNEAKTEIVTQQRPSGIKFEKMNATDKKKSLSRVMSAFTPPP